MSKKLLISSSKLARTDQPHRARSMSSFMTMAAPLLPQGPPPNHSRFPDEDSANGQRSGSIRVVKGRTGPRSQQRAVSPPAGPSQAGAAALRTAWAGKAQGPPGRPPRT